LVIDDILQRDELMAPYEAEAMPIRRIEEKDHAQAFGATARDESTELLENRRRRQTSDDPDPSAPPALRHPPHPKVHHRTSKGWHGVITERAVESGGHSPGCGRHVQRIDPATGSEVLILPRLIAEMPMTPRDRVNDDGRRGVV